MITSIFFNLLLNSVFSMALALSLVYIFIWFFRVGTDRWKLILLSLPFIKIVYDSLRGVPEKSILFSGVDPFTLPPRHQILSVGAGFDKWTPFISTVFSVQGPNGKTYHSSVGDYVLIWVNRTFGPQASSIVVFAALATSFTLLARRLIHYRNFEIRRRSDRKSQTSFKVQKLGRRSIDIYISDKFSGSPFTGGFRSPYICLPKDAVGSLNKNELNAVIAHEMAHIRYYDLIFTIAVQALGDLFWFIPGYRWLSRKIDRMREIAADEWATSIHHEPQCLASALLKLKDVPEVKSRFTMYSGFFREKSLIKDRIERLLGITCEKQPRFGWQIRLFRYGATALISIVILHSVFGGNFRSNEIREAPRWLTQLLKVSCICVNKRLYVQV